MKFLNRLIQDQEPLSFILLIIAFEVVLLGAMFLGWVLLKDSSIIISIVGSIIFLISSGYFILSLLALIMAIFINMQD